LRVFFYKVELVQVAPEKGLNFIAKNRVDSAPYSGMAIARKKIAGLYESPVS